MRGALQFAPMWRLFMLLLLRRVSTEECANVPLTDSRNSSRAGSLVLRLPRPSPVLSDIIGLDEAKEVLREAVVLPSKMETSVARLFWRSGERSAVLLAGPSGLGKAAAAEAAAAAAGALVLVLPATEAASSGFCRSVLASAGKQPVVVIVEAIDAAPASALAIQQCLREAYDRDETVARVFIVATMSHELSTLSATALVPFGYTVRLGLPNEAERKQFLMRLLQQISRIDPQWSSALREAEVSTLVNLTAKYTFGEMELVVRRAFVRSTNAEGERDTVALHHFEHILAGMPPQATEAFNETYVVAESPATTGSGEAGAVSKAAKDDGKKKPKEAKDPMDGIFGWCNFWLPEALHLPPVVWAMIIFGILAHFMARSTYQPYGHRKRRGGSGPRSSLFSDLGAGSPQTYPTFGDSINDWYSSGSPFANFPPPPGMARPEGGAGGGADGAAAPGASASGMPTAGEPTVAGPPH